MFRAVLEGVAKGTRLILDTMAKAGYRPESITIAGGAARSTLWLQVWEGDTHRHTRTQTPQTHTRRLVHKRLAYMLVLCEGHLDGEVRRNA